ncbi:MAG: hypothetical protein NVSMB60_23050 [Mycobacterium sp.]
MLLSLLNVLFDEGLTDTVATTAQATGVDKLRALVADFRPERTAERTGLTADSVRQTGKGFRRGAFCYRVRSHWRLPRSARDRRQLSARRLVGGHGKPRPPGRNAICPWRHPIEELGEKSGNYSYGEARSRVGGHPDVLGTSPATLMADEMTLPEPGQIRAFITTAGNPVLSVPNGEALERALQGLDLFVSLDLYVNETNRHADYVLPSTTFLERSDMQWGFASASPTVFMQSIEAVVKPYGQAREERRVYDEIARRMGKSLFAVGPLTKINRVLTWLERRRHGYLTPPHLIALLLRIGPYGDRFGLRRHGLNPRRLRDHPHGVVLAQHAPTGLLRHVVQHSDNKVHLAPEEIIGEVARLGERHPTDPTFPLLMIGLRELRSQNSWMHNSPTLMKSARPRRHRARVNPVDATQAGLVDGGPVRIVSPHGAIETEVLVTDEVGVGTIAVPHGWGHRGGWQRANRAGGANVNALTSNRSEDLELLAGMSLLNGVAVRLEVVDPAAVEHV